MLCPHVYASPAAARCACVCVCVFHMWHVLRQAATALWFVWLAAKRNGRSCRQTTAKRQWKREWEGRGRSNRQTAFGACFAFGAAAKYATQNTLQYTAENMYFYLRATTRRMSNGACNVPQKNMWYFHSLIRQLQKGISGDELKSWTCHKYQREMHDNARHYNWTDLHYLNVLKQWKNCVLSARLFSIY